MRLVAGLDVGTTGCKVTVFTTAGERLGREYRDYPVKRAADSQEVDASALAESVLDCVKSAAARFGKIEAMGVASFGEAFVLVDAAGKPLRPIILCTDPRGARECAELSSRLGAEKIAAASGVKPHSMYSLPKLLWIKAHEPEIFAKAKYAMLVEDYVIWLLTGERVIDYSLATRTMAFDIRSLAWSEEIFSAAGVDSAMFSRPVPVGTVAGETADGIKIVAAGHDQVAAAIGAGAFEPGTAVDGAGTVECITPVYAEVPSGTLFQENNYCVVPYFGNYVAYAYSYTGGALLQWCAGKLLGRDHKDLQSGERKGPTGILVLPHFAGAATPYMDTGSKGAIVGLTLATGPEDVYVACMEGVAYEMRVNMEYLAASGVRFGRLVATGGGAKSPLWMQIKADVLAVPIDTLETEDAGTVGSAMLCSVAIGAYGGLEEAKSAFVRVTGSYAPDMARHAEYDKVYRRFEKLYKAVRPLT